MNEKQKTAVRWLKGQLEVTHDPAIREWLFDKALEMEEEQHRRSYIHGLASWHSDVKFEDYYKNSFNNR